MLRSLIGPGDSASTLADGRSGLRPAILLALAILVVASLVNSFFLPVAGRRVRPEHVAGPVVFVVFALSQLVRKHVPVRIDAFSALAVSWVLVNGLSSWLYAPQQAESFVHVVRMGILAAIFLTVSNLPPFDGATWAARFRMWIALGLLALTYGALVWSLARYADIWLPGVSHEVAVTGISVRGTQLERNLFGILAGTLLSVAFYCLLSQRARGRSVIASTGFLVAACALASSTVVLSLTRSTWMALVVSGPLAYLVFDRRRFDRADRPLLQVTALLPVLLGAALLLWQAFPGPTRGPGSAIDAGSSATIRNRATSGIRDRLSTFGRLETDITVNTRLQDAQWALGDWRASPLLGHGTGSFVQLHGIRVGTEAWISNLVLHTMVDTGLVGLAIQLSLLLLVARRAWHAAQATTVPQLQVGLKAMTLGFLVMVIAYQITDGTWLAVFWVHIGLMVNGIYCVRDEQRRLAENPAALAAHIPQDGRQV